MGLRERRRIDVVQSLRDGTLRDEEEALRAHRVVHEQVCRTLSEAIAPRGVTWVRNDVRRRQVHDARHAPPLRGAGVSGGE